MYNHYIKTTRDSQLTSQSSVNYKVLPIVKGIESSTILCDAPKVLLNIQANNRLLRNQLSRNIPDENYHSKRFKYYSPENCLVAGESVNQRNTDLDTFVKRGIQMIKWYRNEK